MTMRKDECGDYIIQEDEGALLRHFILLNGKEMGEWDWKARYAL
jgi:hypothetical protein